MMPFRRLFSKSPKVPVFILGCQRSGTTMLEATLVAAPGVSVYREGDRKAMRKPFYRLREPRAIRRLLARDPSEVIVFKPLNDSQHADRLLEMHEGARAVWIYRGFEDTANSMVRKWGAHEKNIIDWINGASPPGDDPLAIDSYRIYAERMTSETRRHLREVAGDEITDAEGAALVWYIRNRIYFDLELDADDRVLLVRYEDLVGAPEAHLTEIFRFVGCDARPDAALVNTKSVGKDPPPILSSEIEKLCHGLLERLDAARQNGGVRRGDGSRVDP